MEFESSKRQFRELNGIQIIKIQCIICGDWQFFTEDDDFLNLSEIEDFFCDDCLHDNWEGEGVISEYFEILDD